MLKPAFKKMKTNHKFIAGQLIQPGQLGKTGGWQADIIGKDMQKPFVAIGRSVVSMFIKEDASDRQIVLIGEEFFSLVIKDWELCQE